MVEYAFPSGCACCLSRVWASVSMCDPCLLALPPQVGLLALGLSVLTGAHRRGACKPLPVLSASGPWMLCASCLCQTPREALTSSPCVLSPTEYPAPLQRRTWPLSSTSLPHRFSWVDVSFIRKRAAFVNLQVQAGPIGPDGICPPRNWGRLSPQVSQVYCPPPERTASCSQESCLPFGG